MLEEMQKSIKAVLYDRLTSPLAGTFILSWLLWNWGLIYYVLAGDEMRNMVDRIGYIKNNFFQLKYLLIYPSVSAAFLIFLYPYAANYVYKKTLGFNRKKKDVKDEIEREQRLTLKESLEIRNEIKKIEERFFEANKKKDEEIKLLMQENEALKEKLNKNNENTPGKDNEALSKIEEKKDLDNEYNKFIKSKFAQNLKNVATSLNRGWSVTHNTNDDAVNYLLALDLIKQKSAGGHLLTEKGKYFMKKLYENEERVGHLI